MSHDLHAGIALKFRHRTSRSHSWDSAHPQSASECRQYSTAPGTSYSISAFAEHNLKRCLAVLYCLFWSDDLEMFTAQFRRRAPVLPIHLSALID